MRFLIAFVLVLGLLLQVGAQTTSDTSSNTWTNSVTPSFSNSNSNSNSVTNSNTNSVTNSRTPSWTNSNTNSVTATVTHTSTGTPTATTTYPQPPAPIIDGNFCLHHIINICPSWHDPAGFSFNKYRLYYQLQGSTTINVVVVTQTSQRITGLTANSPYNVWVQGVDTTIGVFSANSTVVVMTTDPSDPKNNPALDIQNFACVKGTNAKNGRVDVVCSWTAAQVTVKSINLKAHCVSASREPLFIRKHLFGTKAQVTSVTFAIDRTPATCNFFARFYYARRPTTRHHFQLSV